MCYARIFANFCENFANAHIRFCANLCQNYAISMQCLSRFISVLCKFYFCVKKNTLTLLSHLCQILKAILFLIGKMRINNAILGTNHINKSTQKSKKKEVANGLFTNAY